MGRLAATSRVVIENFRTGVAEELGLTRAMGLFLELDGRPGVLSPRLGGVPSNGGAHYPTRGAHTDEILGEIADLEGTTPS